MNSWTPASRRRFHRIASIVGSAAFVGAVFLAYRWAEPSPDVLASAHPLGGSSATIRLTDTIFAGYEDGARTWSLHAGQVNLLQLPNSSMANIQSASIVDIRDGTLYDPPAKSSPGFGAATTRVMEAGAPPTVAGPVSARFHAKQGRYSLGMLETIPPDLEMLYTVKWQFKLVGDVSFRTRAKDELTAPSMTIYSLVSRRNGRQEQRIICDQGGKMTHRGIQVTANTIRFNPQDRTVECLSGVRGTFKKGNVQAERVYWSLDQETLRCPESATGTVLGMPFVFEGVELDLKKGEYRAKHFRVQVNRDRLENLKE